MMQNYKTSDSIYLSLEKYYIQKINVVENQEQKYFEKVTFCFCKKKLGILSVNGFYWILFIQYEL